MFIFHNSEPEPKGSFSGSISVVAMIACSLMHLQQRVRTMVKLLTGLLGVLVFYWTPSGQSETSIFCSHGVRYSHILVSVDYAADVCRSVFSIFKCTCIHCVAL